MDVRVSIEGKFLTPIFADFVGGQRVLFNFKFEDGYIDYQILNDYTVEGIIPFVLESGKPDGDISFWINNSSHIFEKDSEDLIYLTANDIGITFEQGSCNCTYEREYEARREFPILEESMFTKAFAKRLRYLSTSAVRCSEIAKGLSIPNPDPVITGGTYYLDYWQYAFVDKIDYPECSFTSSMLRGFASKLADSATYAYLKDRNLMCFVSGRYTLWVPTVNFKIDSTSIKEIRNVIDTATPFAKVNFNKFLSQFEIIAKAFPKQKLILTIGENTFTVGATSMGASVTVGDFNPADKVLRTNITPGCLNVISKLFNEDEPIEILKGANAICLRHNEKNFVIAGMTY